MKRVGSFKDFCLNEAKVGNKSIGRATELIARYFSTKAGSSYVEYGRINVSKYGKNGVIQNIYIDKKDGSAIGINWTDDGNFLGISMWDEFHGATGTPSREIEIEGVDASDTESFATYLPRAVRLAFGESDEDMDEKFQLSEAASSFNYNGQTYRGVTNLIKAVYEDGEDVDRAQEIIRGVYGNSSYDRFVQTAFKLLSSGQTEIKAADVYAALNKKLGKVASPVKVVAGKTQQEEDSEEEENEVKEFMKTKVADPAIVYKHLEAYTKSVADGATTALLVTGKGGTGKSYTITKILKETADGEWCLMKGKASARAMYVYLYNHYNKICVFDDCDSVFANADGINVLKGALDTSDNRVIGWLNSDSACVNTEGMNHEEIEMALADFEASHGGKAGFPSEFVFEGQVIFISNLTLEQIRKKDSALLTRCQVIDVTLDAKGLLSRMETILPSLRYYKARCVDGQKVEMTNEEDKIEVFEYLKTEEVQKRLQAKGEEFSIRTLIKACKLKASVPDMWKEIV